MIVRHMTRHHVNWVARGLHSVENRFQAPENGWHGITKQGNVDSVLGCLKYVLGQTQASPSDPLHRMCCCRIDDGKP